MAIIERTLNDIIDTEFREYSMYTIENRAIPSVIDGLKPTQRKILYSMLSEYKSSKVKIAELGGGLAKYNYHHGESSAQSTAIGMGQDWNNNAPLLKGHGNFGSRLITAAAAPRYIYATLSDNFKQYFVDTEVAPKSFDDENPEPAFYLPVIPWILVNGISGIAVGFKTEVLPRSVDSLVRATRECLANPSKFLENNRQIIPTFPSFKGTVEHVANNQWKTVGIIEDGLRNSYVISELPIGFDRESYVEFLNGLIDKDLIRDYDDTCSKDGFGFVVKATPQQREDIEKDRIKFFKLEKTHTEILTTLGYDGKLKIFQSVAELIHYFVEYRLSKFEDKRQYDIAKSKQSVYENQMKIKFIKTVINNKVDFKKSTKQKLLDFISQFICKDDFAKKFINIPLYMCTTDEIEKLESEIAKLESELQFLDNTTAMQMYATRLTDL